MIEIAPFLHPLERGSLEAVRRYLAAAGVDDADYAVVPDGSPAPAVAVTIVYRPAPGRGYARATIGFPLGQGRGAVDLTLPEAGRFLCMLLAHGWAEQARATDPEAPRDALFEAFGLDRWTYWRIDVRATQPGRHVGRGDGGYVFYHVDERGGIRIEAHSASLAAVIIRLAADLEAERINLSGALGRLRPSDEEVGA